MLRSVTSKNKNLSEATYSDNHTCCIVDTNATLAKGLLISIDKVNSEKRLLPFWEDGGVLTFWVATPHLDLGVMVDKCHEKLLLPWCAHICRLSWDILFYETLICNTKGVEYS
ncbi:hypothetical protein CDAR_15011 [Caerostris darwini]|uniref:Uncharacterized protein n=1 Tax=Caerostris darwini TaxID=1538125 RepID=A0AAV4PAI8_9ARAC|nr:hypothetical protein CDAR_15011 [Caerostris darwini]